MYSEDLPQLLRCPQVCEYLLMRLKALLLLVYMPVIADESDWQQPHVIKDGISIAIKQVEGSKYKEFRASVDLQTTPASAVALLQDNDACARWVHRCVNSEVIEEVNETERYFYQVTSLPFPARSRDAVFHGSIEFQADQGITITITSAHDRFPLTKHVRITESHGSYHIEPIGSNSIRLTWQFYVDPAGTLPALLVNSMIKELPFQSLSAFRELVKQRPYKDATFTYDASGRPSNISFAPKDQKDNS